jgi:hypothetical protein
MSALSMKHILNSVKPENKDIMILNVNTLINSFFGFLIALTFNDVKDTLVENVLLKIVHANINESKKKIKFLNAEINLELILDMFIRMLLIVLFIYIGFRTSKSLNI